MVIRCSLALAALVLILTSPALATAPAPFVPILDTGDIIPPIPLTAQDGRRFSPADLRPNAVIISFIYTRCGDARMCPLVSAKFARMSRSIDGAPIRLLLLTLDPAFDTPAVLRRYGRSFDQNPRLWTLATGSAAATGELAARLGIATQTRAPGAIVHTEAAIVVAPDGSIAQTTYGNDWQPADLLAAARATLPGSHDAFASIRAVLSSALARCGGGAALGTGSMVALFAGITALIGGAFAWAFATGRPRRRPL